MCMTDGKNCRCSRWNKLTVSSTFLQSRRRDSAPHPTKKKRRDHHVQLKSSFSFFSECKCYSGCKTSSLFVILSGEMTTSTNRKQRSLYLFRKMFNIEQLHNCTLSLSWEINLLKSSYLKKKKNQHLESSVRILCCLFDFLSYKLEKLIFVRTFKIEDLRFI